MKVEMTGNVDVVDVVDVAMIGVEGMVRKRKEKKKHLKTLRRSGAGKRSASESRSAFTALLLPWRQSGMAHSWLTPLRRVPTP